MICHMCPTRGFCIRYLDSGAILVLGCGAIKKPYDDLYDLIWLFDVFQSLPGILVLKPERPGLADVRQGSLELRPCTRPRDVFKDLRIASAELNLAKIWRWVSQNFSG